MVSLVNMGWQDETDKANSHSVFSTQIRQTYNNNNFKYWNAVEIIKSTSDWTILITLTKIQAKSKSLDDRSSHFKKFFFKGQTYADGNFKGCSLIWQRIQVQWKHQNSAFRIMSPKLRNLLAWPQWRRLSRLENESVWSEECTQTELITNLPGRERKDIGSSFSH